MEYGICECGSLMVEVRFMCTFCEMSFCRNCLEQIGQECQGRCFLDQGNEDLETCLDEKYCCCTECDKKDTNCQCARKVKEFREKAKHTEIDLDQRYLCEHCPNTIPVDNGPTDEEVIHSLLQMVGYKKGLQAYREELRQLNQRT